MISKPIQVNEENSGFDYNYYHYGIIRNNLSKN
uniref:Uncharacterized protein n=1 Tax=Heterorhabditis bacteriophora TaxID=37862 RepID=A0A1I7WCH3_HETBA